MRKNCGIIFDLDGTLVDTIDDLGDAANTLFRRHGYPEHSREDFVSWIGNGARKFIEQGIGSVIDEQHIATYVNEFKDIYADNLSVKSRLYPGIDALLNILADHKIPCALLSNKPHRHTMILAEKYLGHWPLYPVFGQREEVPRKPDPAAALEIAGIMGLDPGCILFVGDSQGDMETALAAGMIPVGVSWGYGNPHEVSQVKNTGDPDLFNDREIVIIDDPSGILDLLDPAENNHGVKK